MKNIIYFESSDKTNFDFDRFYKSINSYAKVPEKAVREVIKELDRYENMHVSLLVEAGVKLLEKYGDEKIAENYYNDHSKYFGAKFERLRRITGYLVGTLERWNDAKQAEEHARVKHSVNSCVDDLTRAARLQDQALACNAAYVGKTE